MTHRPAADTRRVARGAFVFPVVLGVLFGMCSSVVLAQGALQLDQPLPYLFSALFALVFCALFSLLARILEPSGSEGGPTGRTSPAHRPPSPEPLQPVRGAKGTVRAFFRDDRSPLLRWDAVGVAVTGALIFLCWLPWLLAMQPGVFWADTANQVAWALNDYWKILAQHPLFDTVVMGWFAEFGIARFANAFTGIYLLILVQSVLGAFSMGAVCCYVRGRLGVNRAAALVALAFSALFYVLPLFMGTLAKDTMALPFFLLFSLAFAEAVRTRGCALTRPGWVAVFCVAGVLFALTKKPGLYIVCACAIVAFICARGARARAMPPVLAVVAVLCANLVMPAIVTGPMHREIVPDGREEALAVPLQQLANAVRTDPDSFTSDEHAVVNATYFMGFYGIDPAYNWMCADGVKKYSEPDGADYDAFLALWARKAPTHAAAYTEAWCGLVADWFSFGKEPDLVFNFYSGEINEEFMNLPGYEPEAAGASALEMITGAIGAIPGMGIVAGKALWASVIPVFCLFAAVARRDGIRARRLAMLVPLLATCAFLLVGPVSIWNEGIRYVMPLVFAAPLNLSIAFAPQRCISSQGGVRADAAFRRAVG